MEQIVERVLELLHYDASAPLIFNSGLFLFLFVGFSAGYVLMRRASTLRILYVILFSIYFYYKSSGIYFLLLVFVAVSDYWIAHGIAAARSKKTKRWLVALSVAVNLGMLGYFKYTNFFIEIANNIFGAGFLDFRNIFLPVGISFFVFQSMSYTIDVYRGVIRPLDRWIDYMFYLSFFPQLVAGPIVRARDFLPQIRQNPLTVTREMFGRGIFLIMIGLIKKAIISDYISVNFVDRVFDNPMLYSGFENLMGVYGYALQIYCDFSGYSDMAIGIALLLGFRFPKNFDSPYKSATVTEFWHRWHISLSTWLKDYLYISLGGNRKGRLRTYVNLILTMLLGGLWHGASLRFMLWGGYHGVLLALHKGTMALFPRMKPVGESMKRGWRALGILVTFHLVCLGWIFFRARDVETGRMVIEQIFTNFDPSLIAGVASGYWPVMAMMGVGYVTHFIPQRWQDRVCGAVMRSSLVGCALLLALIIWVVMQVKSANIQPFIYFQF